MKPKWKEYEEQVYARFMEKYSPSCNIEHDVSLDGRFSKVGRQVDICVRGEMAGMDLVGIFDCKCFNKKIDVKVIDSMVGFMLDVGGDFGGIVTVEGFTTAAMDRAEGAGINLKIIEFESVEQIVDRFISSLDFSDPRNSQYIPLLF